MGLREVIGLIPLVVLFGGCRPESLRSVTIHGVTLSPEEVATILEHSPLPEIPEETRNAVASDPQAIRLGQFLFHDTALSSTGTVSCATCHQPERDWTDGLPLSQGVAEVSRDAPTLWNGAYQRWYFWDGRADSLWAQSLGPIESHKEMAGSRGRVYRRVAETPRVRSLYQTVFGPIPKLESEAAFTDARPTDGEDEAGRAWSGLSPEDQSAVNRVFANTGKAIAAFERTLVSRDAPLDRFVAALRVGDREGMDAYPADALRGLRTFIGEGQCILCHVGPNFTDREFHNIGLDRGGPVVDEGRFAGVAKAVEDPFNGLGAYSDDTSEEANTALTFVAQKPDNLGEFKTPTLRNVAGTAPYMHDGRFADLGEVIRFYSELDQEPAVGHREESLQPLHLSPAERTDLRAFLESLTGAPLAPEATSAIPLSLL